MRDHQHPRRDTGQSKMQADLEAANGTSICADYFFPRDKPGDKHITAIAICDVVSQYLAGHVVDSKGASAEHAVGQVLRDLRKMGHYGQVEKDGSIIFPHGFIQCRREGTRKCADRHYTCGAE